MSDRETLNAAELAQVDYTLDVTRLDDQARDTLAKGAALTAGVLRNYARIAYRAGRAERTDPEPSAAMCGICKGIRVCDLREHGRVGF